MQFTLNSPAFLKMPHLSELIKLMHLLPEKLNGELEVFRCMLASKDCDDFQKILKVAFDYKAAFPEVYKLLYFAEFNFLGLPLLRVKIPFHACKEC